MNDQDQQKSDAEDLREDAQDLMRARGDAQIPARPLPLWRHLGPGLITGAADDDPSGIGTYSVAGAQFGYGMLWLAPWCVPLMIAVQEMCGRIAVVTGKGLAAVLKENYPPWMLHLAVALLVIANTINIWADLNVMAASAQMLCGLSLEFWLTAITLLTLALIVFVPYRLYVRWLKWMCLALLAYVVTPFFPGIHIRWGEVVRHLTIPQWSGDSAFVLTVVGFLGTTISPYCFFWQASETVEEEVAAGTVDVPGHRLTPVTAAEIRTLRADSVVGMTLSQVITVFIIMCASATLHDRGLTDIETAQDAARALLPLGKPAYVLFTAGIIGTGLLAIPTLAGSAAYAVAEVAGWRYGLYRRFRRARGFYVTIAVVVLVGYLLNFVHSISPVKGLLYAAVLNGVVAPPLIVLVLRICNDPKIVGARRNGIGSNLLGWITVILMTVASALMFWALFTGKA